MFWTTATPRLAPFLNTKASVAPNQTGALEAPHATLPFAGVSYDPGVRAFLRRKGRGDGVLPSSRVRWLSFARTRVRGLGSPCLLCPRVKFPGPQKAHLQGQVSALPAPSILPAAPLPGPGGR